MLTLKKLIESLDRQRVFVRNAHSARIESIAGEVLVVGHGGKRLHKPGSADNCVYVDVSDRANKLLSQNGSLNVLAANANALPFKPCSFDVVIAEFLYCSVNSERDVVREFRRVLKDSGVTIGIEHTAPNSILVRRCLRPIDEAYASVFAGCHLTRDPIPILKEEGFVISEETRSTHQLVPWCSYVAMKA